MVSETVQVAVADIDIAATRFRISSDQGGHDLRESIRVVGLLFQPTLIKHEDKLCIVCGFRRIKALCELDIDTLPATVLSGDSDPLTCVRMAIADNAYRRELNPVELARAYHLLLDATGDIDAVSREATFLNIPHHPVRIAKNLRIFDMSFSLQDCLRDNRISLSIALQLVEMPSEDTEAFVDMCNRFHPGLNRQKEIHSMVNDIASRDDLPFHEVLEKALAGQKSEDSQLTSPLEFKKMLDRLRAFRYPSIIATEQCFQQAVAKLQPGNGIQLEAPKNFENSMYRLHMLFSNVTELKQRRDEIIRLSDHPDIHTFFQ